MPAISGNSAKVMILFMKTTIIVEALVIIFYVVARLSGLVKGTEINLGHVIIAVTYIIILLLILLFVKYFFHRMKIEKLSEALFIKYFLYSFILNVLIELIEDSGFFPGRFFPYVLINDYLLIMILTGLYYLIYRLTYIIGNKVKKNILSLPATLIGLVIFFFTLSISIYGVINGDILVRHDLFTIGDVFSNIIILGISFYYLLKISQYTIYAGFFDAVDIFNGIILLGMSYSIMDIFDEYLTGNAQLFLEYALTAVLSITIAVFTIVIVALGYLLLVMQPIVTMEGIRDLHVLLLAEYTEPYITGSNIFSQISTMMNKFSDGKDKILILVGRLTSLNKLLMRIYLGDTQIIWIRPSEYGTYEIIENPSDRYLNIVKIYDIAPSPTHLIGALSEISGQYKDKDLYLVFHTLTELGILMGFKRLYYTLLSFIKGREYPENIVASFYVVVKEAHDASEINLLKNIIPRVITV